MIMKMLHVNYFYMIMFLMEMIVKKKYIKNLHIKMQRVYQKDITEQYSLMDKQDVVKHTQ